MRARARDWRHLWEQIAVTELTDCRVSTVYFNGQYETQILGGRYDGELRRYATREAALAGHAATVIGLGAR